MNTSERLRKVQKSVPICTYQIDTGFRRIEQFLEDYEVNMDPVYQRDYVWNLKQKQKFVGACLENHRMIPVFWFNFYKVGQGTNSPCEVVDGKQRLEAIRGFLRNEYSAICPCGEVFTAEELLNDPISNRNLSSSITLKMHFIQVEPVDAMQFYLRLNAGGTIHSQEDLDRVKEYIIQERAKVVTGSGANTGK